jgi:hypothetical protein
VDIVFRFACLSLLLSSCAAGAAQDRNTTVSVLADQDSQRLVPTPIDPKLPSVDRIAYQVHREFGSSASTDLRLCVHPNGEVASVLLIGGSSLPAFDLAVVDDAAEWKFTKLPGPSSLERCEKAKVVYLSDL